MSENTVVNSRYNGRLLITLTTALNMAKLDKNTFPNGHGPNDFTCFGPAATKDGQFDGTYLCDMGCFKQEVGSDKPVDSNKYFHGSVVQSKKNSKFYAYFEWARTGAKNPAFQFVECNSKEEAHREYATKLLSKNVKRGEWFVHPSLGKILRAKAGEDCYLVRPQAVRCTGLPDARTISQNEGTKKVSEQVSLSKKSTIKSVCDEHTLALMRDLNIGAIQYTRSAMADAAIPTQLAIDEARTILAESQKRIHSVGDNINDQIQDRELLNLTSLMYSRIPKKKDRNASPSTWILSANNVAQWYLDLDAFENALYASQKQIENPDPFAGLNIRLSWLSPQNELGRKIAKWFLLSTQHKHANIRDVKIKNIWQCSRESDTTKIRKYQNQLGFVQSEYRPLHQFERFDLDQQTNNLYKKTNTCLLFHGTRSVNVSGILRESWKSPKDLVGVKITAWMFGAAAGYFADDYKKSAQYCSIAAARYAKGDGAIANRGAFMFVGDVVLGNTYIAKDAYPFTKAPNGYHSVGGKGGYTNSKFGKLLNNEWIVYDANQCAVKYLIEFECYI